MEDFFHVITGKRTISLPVVTRGKELRNVDEDKERRGEKSVSEHSKEGK